MGKYPRPSWGNAPLSGLVRLPSGVRRSHELNPVHYFPKGCEKSW